jgi:hypothetical protein
VLVTGRKLLLSLMSVAALGVGGCDLVVQGESFFSAGSARIGDDYYVFARLCDGERVEGVEVIDNEASSKIEDSDPSDLSLTWWKVDKPKATAGDPQFVKLGDDDAYETVTVAKGANIALPEYLGVTFKVVGPGGGGKPLGEVFKISDVPVYPEKTDPTSVKYRITDDDDVTQLLTGPEISERSRCALDHVA